jgi:thioredoxin 2
MRSVPDPTVLSAAAPASVAIVTNAEDFDRLVLHGPRPVVVEFGAAWSGTSRTLGAQVAALARHFAGEVVFVRVDAEAAPALVQREAVAQVPTLRCYLRGHVVSVLVGAASGLEMDRWVRSNARRGRTAEFFRRLGGRTKR